MVKISWRLLICVHNIIFRFFKKITFLSWNFNATNIQYFHLFTVALQRYLKLCNIYDFLDFQELIFNLLEVILPLLTIHDLVIIIFNYWGKILLCYSAQDTVNHTIFHLPMGNRHFCQPCVSASHCYLSSFWVVLSLALRSYLTLVL